MEPKSIGKHFEQHFKGKIFSNFLNEFFKDFNEFTVSSFKMEKVVNTIKEGVLYKVAFNFSNHPLVSPEKKYRWLLVVDKGIVEVYDSAAGSNFKKLFQDL